jgi:hypothetical protein
MPKLRQLAFSGEIISEDITAQVHWLMKGDGRKRGQIKLDAKSKSRQAYTRWYAYCGEDDIWEDDWTNPTYKVEEICEISVADHGGNEFLDEKMYYPPNEENYFGLLVQISHKTKGLCNHLALVCKHDFDPIEEIQEENQ